MNERNSIHPSIAVLLIITLLISIVVQFGSIKTPNMPVQQVSTEGVNYTLNFTKITPITVRADPIAIGVSLGYWEYSLNTSALTAVGFPTDLDASGVPLVIRVSRNIPSDTNKLLQAQLDEIFEKNATEISPEAYVRALILDTYWERLVAILAKNKYPQASSVAFSLSPLPYTYTTYTLTPFGNETPVLFEVADVKFYPLTPILHSYPPFISLEYSNTYLASLLSSSWGTYSSKTKTNTYYSCWWATSPNSTQSYYTCSPTAVRTTTTYYIKKTTTSRFSFIDTLTVYRFWGNEKAVALTVWEESGSFTTTISPATSETYYFTLTRTTDASASPVTLSRTIIAEVVDSEEYYRISWGANTFEPRPMNITRNPFRASYIVIEKIGVASSVETRGGGYITKIISNTWPTFKTAETYTYNPIPNAELYSTRVSHAYNYPLTYGSRDLESMFAYAYLSSLIETLQSKVATNYGSLYYLIDEVLNEITPYYNAPKTQIQNPYYVLRKKKGDLAFIARKMYQYAFPVYNLTSDKFIVIVPIEDESSMSDADVTIQEVLLENPYIKVELPTTDTFVKIDNAYTNPIKDYVGFFRNYAVYNTTYTYMINGTLPVTTVGWLPVTTGYVHYWRSYDPSASMWIPLCSFPRAESIPPELPTGFLNPLPIIPTLGPTVTMTYDYNPVPYIGFEYPQVVVIKQYDGSIIFYITFTDTNGNTSISTHLTPR